MAKPLKDGLDERAIQRLARNLERAHPRFDASGFVRDCVCGLAKLELKQRVRHVIGVLERYLPRSFAAASPILRRAATHWQEEDAEDPLRGFAAWPLIDYVGVHGVADFERGMATLHDLTHLFTAEFAIRPFIAAEPERALAIVRTWLNDENPAVRRLCSEGLRPLLPWGPRVRHLSEHPEAIIAVLDELAFDTSEDVRRSVANNLNDISKSAPELVVDTCSRWLNNASQEQRVPTQRLVKHATRTLVKNGHTSALALQGVDGKPQLSVAFEVTPKRLTLGGALSLSAKLTSKADVGQKLVVDFVVHHQRANQGTRGKVFKWKTLELAAGASVALHKRHPVRSITTRKYYTGRHLVELVANGQRVATAAFTLDVPKQ